MMLATPVTLDDLPPFFSKPSSPSRLAVSVFLTVLDPFPGRILFLEHYHTDARSKRPEKP